MSQGDVNVIIKILDEDTSLPQQLNIYIAGYGFVDSVNATISSQSNSYPSPIGRQFTSTRRMNPDELNIDGEIYCIECGGVIQDISAYLLKLKNIMTRYQYQTNLFAEITTDWGIFKNMGLNRCSFSTSDDAAQRTTISQSWVEENLAGTMLANQFSLGGLMI